MNDAHRCEICGEPMPQGEEMFKYHGYSGSCPKPKQEPPEEVVAVHVTPTINEGCDHDWPDDIDGQTDMYGCCTKCGMSFQRYIHTECP